MFLDDLGLREIVLKVRGKAVAGTVGFRSAKERHSRGAKGDKETKKETPSD